MKVLLTGASGFVGRALAERLPRSAELTLVAGPKGAVGSDAPGRRWVRSDLSDDDTDLGALTAGHDVVVHAAGLAHVRRGGGDDSWERFERINVTLTDRLARAAAGTGVRRLIFMSSGAVNGIETLDRPFAEADSPNPSSNYGRSKMLAEARVLDACAGTDMSCTLIRPPVLVGAGSPGNIALMLKIVRSGLPLPLAGLQNRRSYLSVRNLADLVDLCTTHPAAANQVFMATDLPSLSTAEIARMLARHDGRPCRLVPVPTGMVKAAAAALGRLDSLRPLWSTLELDAGKARSMLGWTSEQSLDDAFAEVVHGQIGP